MLDLLLLPLLLQLTNSPLTGAPDEFFEQFYSDAATEILERDGDFDLNKVTRDLERLGEQGDDSAVQALGEIYSFGPFDNASDPERGCDYFERVADRRPDAMHNLATCYFNGRGREQDLPKAREIYIEAAEAGWRTSFCAYGNMLVRGQGGAIDAEEGVRLCRMTAVLGDADAQTDYGTYLLTGQGIERDPVAARFMLDLAGTQGQQNAAFLLGQIYTRGDGTDVDHVSAGDWFIKAFESGRSDAALQAARSFLRRGYTDNEDGTMTVRPDLLREAQGWLATALEVEQPGTERYSDVQKFVRATEQLIASGTSADD